jgi:hypothetical protein
VVGEAHGPERGPAIATSDALSLGSGDRALLHVVVEGERDGFPVYCLDGPRIRVRGRAIPERLLLTPADAGLAEAEVHWTELRPDRDGAGWIRHRVPAGEARWTLELQQFAPDPRSPQEEALWGTARFAAAVDVGAPGGSRVLGSPGWGRGAPPPEEGEAPGLRVSRAAGPTLAGHALALARLPVRPEATPEQVRLRIALRPADLVLAGYEEMAGAPLPAVAVAAPGPPPGAAGGSPGPPSLDGPEWEWLFETLRTGTRRRTVPGAPLVGADARGVPWGPEGADAGDVLLMSGGALAVLEADDGDGWLGEADSVVAAVAGEVRRHVLHDVKGGDVTLLRARDFAHLRAALSRAGYGTLGLASTWGGDLHRAVREFQLDRGFPVTGVPDEGTRAALAEFLARLRAPDGGAAASP